MSGGRADDLQVTSRLVIPRDELVFEAIRGGGPGGQNVNKVATTVLLRFAFEHSRVLDQNQRMRLRQELSGRINREGEIVVRASTQRQQGRNLVDARERLAQLIAAALVRERPRVATRPGRGAVKRRLTAKRQRSERKSERRSREDA